MRDNIIKSVIGFNFDLNLLDINDEPVKTGVISTYIKDKTFRSSNRLQDKHWFTNFNQALLDQVISYKKENI